VSKAFQGKTCVYCTVEGISSTPDHVVARGFFPTEQRHGIPKVPACQSCNNTKSGLETYLTAVLPFGGRHTKSAEILAELAPKRLDRNRKLARELAGSWNSSISISSEGYLQLQHTFNVDADKIEQLYRFIVRGLCWSEWQLLLPETHSEIQVGFLTLDGARLVESLLRGNAKRRCQGMIAAGLFQYEGAQAVDNDLITVWKMSLYGVTFSDGKDSNVRSSLCYASTGPIGKVLPIGSD
jgi:hypothetical protein